VNSGRLLAHLLLHSDAHSALDLRDHHASLSSSGRKNM